MECNKAEQAAPEVSDDAIMGAIGHGFTDFEKKNISNAMRALFACKAQAALRCTCNIQPTHCMGRAKNDLNTIMCPVHSRQAEQPQAQENLTHFERAVFGVGPSFAALEDILAEYDRRKGKDPEGARDGAMSAMRAAFRPFMQAPTRDEIATAILEWCSTGNPLALKAVNREYAAGLAEFIVRLFGAAK